MKMLPTGECGKRNLINKASNRIPQPSYLNDVVTDDNQCVVQCEEIRKLVLQISHSCNLKCPYCCTDKGLFGNTERKLMPESIALDSLELFAQLFSKIRNIYLFGGEPTLNLTVIDEVCRKIVELVEHGRLKTRPNIIITTNGTLMGEEFIQLVKSYDLIVAVSLDGTQTIHDKLRIDSNGEGTYSRIIKNIKIVRERTQQPSSIGFTYTPFHLNLGIQIWDIIETLKTETGINEFWVNPAFDTYYLTKEARPSVDPFKFNHEKVINEMTELIKKSMRSMATSDDPTVLSIINLFFGRLSNEKNNNGIISCPAGSAYFSVAFDGTIYPCQNLPENCDMRIGHIYEANIETKIFKSNVGGLISIANDYALTNLDDSPLNRFVKVCPAYNLSETYSLTKLAPFRTMMYLSMAREFAINLFEIMTRPEEQNIFSQNIKKYFN